LLPRPKASTLKTFLNTSMDFEKLFSKIPETMVVVSPFQNYRILAATDTYLEVTMRKREDIVGLAFLLEAFPDKEISYEENPVKKSLDKALQTKKVDFLDVIRYDLAQPESAGGGYETRYWEASHTPVLDESGKVEYIIQHTTDVTARELARQAHLDSEAKFKFMTDSVPELIFTADSAGQLTYVNQRWVSYTGLPESDILGSQWQKAVHPDDLAMLVSRQEEALAQGAGYQAEFRLRDAAGFYRWHRTRNLPMKNDSGQISLRVGSNTDIHEAKRLVEELLASNEQMSALADQVQDAYRKADAERLVLERLIMESPAFFCIVKGAGHRFELVNQNYQKLFPSRALLGRTVVEALPEVIEQGFIQILDDVYQTGKSFVAERVPIQLDRQDNGLLEEVFLTFTYQALYENEAIIGILVFGYEVTEEVRYRQKLQQLGVSLNE
jgi:PAS domain S-box-containing protein